MTKGFMMATVNYPAILPHPLVSDGYGFRSNQSQAVGLFDVETQSRDETRTVNVGFTFTDLQYKVFHGWFMNVLIHGQKWFNMRLDGEFYECTFGGVQPQYSLNRKIITVTATLKTRPSTGFVNYTNQRVSYPNTTNYMPSPFDPEGYDFDAGDLVINNVEIANPSGESFVGLVEVINSSQFAFINRGLPQTVNAGDRVFSSILCKDLAYFGSKQNGIRFSYSDSGGFVLSLSVSVSSGALLNVIGNEDFEINITPLSNGFNLIQCSLIISNSDSAFLSSISICDGASQLDTPEAGSKIYAQSAYAGKSGKYQGAISYNAVNYMPSPFDPEGYDFDAGDFVINNVEIANPSGVGIVGLVEVVTSSSFAYINRALGVPVAQGDKIYHSVICRDLTSIGSEPNALRFSYSGSAGFIMSFSVDISSGVVLDIIGSLGFDIKVTSLSNGFNLIETSTIAPNSDAGFFTSISFCDGANQLDTPPVGSQIYVQATYFGKADDWPAIITPADPDQFPAAITYEY